MNKVILIGPKGRYDVYRQGNEIRQPVLHMSIGTPKKQTNFLEFIDITAFGEDADKLHLIPSGVPLEIEGRIAVSEKKNDETGKTEYTQNVVVQSWRKVSQFDGSKPVKAKTSTAGSEGTKETEETEEEYIAFDEVDDIPFF